MEKKCKKTKERERESSEETKSSAAGLKHLFDHRSLSSQPRWFILLVTEYPVACAHVHTTVRPTGARVYACAALIHKS